MEELDEEYLTTIVTELEDEEDGSPRFFDVRDTAESSAKKKINMALKHLNIFLKDYLVQVKATKVADAAELPYSGFECNPPFESKDAFWDDLMGCFFDYLALHAYVGGKSEKGRLSYSSATGYASSIKSFYTNKFRKLGPELRVFTESCWRCLRNKLLTAYKKHALAGGKSILTPHITSTVEDRRALAIGCFWSGSTDLAEFLHLNNAKFHLCGRGSEVSLLRVESLYLKDINELHYSYRALCVRLQRSKGGPCQELPVFPHRDGIHEDFYFSLVYNMVMCTIVDGYMFPKFADRALQKKNEKSDSRVAALWTLYFKGIRKTFEDLSQKINSGLSSHSDKRGSNQLMVDACASSPLVGIFRSGWEVRSVHSLFDYVLGSSKMLNESGKLVSNWTSKIGTVVIGGQPALLYDIVSDTHLVSPFVDALFYNDRNDEWAPDIRSIMVAALLKNYDEFIGIIEQHPDGTFIDHERHPFVAALKVCRQRAGVNEETFLNWCKEVRQGFMNRNLPALPIDLLRREGSDVSSIICDTRTFADHFNALATAYYVLHSDNTRQLDLVQSLNRKVELQGVEIRDTRALVQSVASTVERIASRLEVVVPSDVLPEKESSSFFHGVNIHDAPFFSVVSKRWPGMSPKTVFVSWFDDHLAAGFERDKKSPDWKMRPESDKNRVKSLFSRVKRIVRSLLCFCDYFPSPKPKDHAECLQWYSTLTEMSHRAENLVMKELFGDEALKMNATLALILSNPLCKEWSKTRSDYYRELPYDIPEDIRIYFNRTR